MRLPIKLWIASLMIVNSSHADPVVVNERASMKIFYALLKAGANAVPLNHHHDREHSLQESIQVTDLDCDISLTPRCSFKNRASASGEIAHVIHISGQDAWDVGFNLGEAGVPRTSISGNQHSVRAESLNCILKGAGKTAECTASF